MIHRKFAFLATFVLFAVVTACNQVPAAVENESSIRTSEGTVTTTSETRQGSSMLEAISETKADTPAEAVASRTETIVGTVTVFTAGKKIEVMTAGMKAHGFMLDDKDVAYWIDGVVAVGKRVTVTDETGADKVRRVTVRLSA